MEPIVTQQAEYMVVQWADLDKLLMNKPGLCIPAEDCFGVRAILKGREWYEPIGDEE